MDAEPTKTTDNEKINRIWHRIATERAGGGPWTFLVSERLTYSEFVITQPGENEKTHRNCGATDQALQLADAILGLQGIESVKVQQHQIEVTLAAVFYWGKDGYADKVVELIVSALFPKVSVDIDNAR
ncbi:MAG: hypothetical protein K2X29_06410 [Candidatus Obscuribacterales bacterium]|nr:hypothetical protein [Candidatus Obscuribacterales bacterium]